MAVVIVVFAWRTLFAAVIMFVLIVILDELASADLLPRIGIFNAELGSPTLNTFFYPLVAAAVGAYLARNTFFIPAVLVVLVYWSLGTHILYVVAVPTGQYSLSDIVLSGLPHLLVAIVAACIGAFFGARYFEGRLGNREAAS